MNAIGNINKTNYINTCCTILKPIKSMTKFSYDNMTTQTRESLCSATPKRMIELAKSACCLAEKIKAYFDLKYGDKNYTIISIGRSMSAISEIMQDLGGNVKFIPLSEMKKNSEIPNNSIHIFKKYLESIGLNKEQIEKNSQHKYILFDYAYSGKSLENATELLTDNNLLGKLPNIESVESNKFIGNWYKLFSYSRFKEFSPVGKLPLENLEDVFIQSSPDTAKEYTSDMAKIIRKLFRFHIFNCLKTKNYHIENPSLELNALARYETQEFLKYKFNKIKWNIFPE